MEDFDALYNFVNDKLKRNFSDSNFNIGTFLKEVEQEFKNQGFRNRDSHGVENILIVKVDAIGDFILSTPAIRELRMNYPFAHITLVIMKNIYPMAELCPYVNEIICIDDKIPNERDIIGMFHFATEFSKKYLWKRRYNLAFALRVHDANKIFHVILMYMSGALNRVGYIYGLIRILLGIFPPNEKNLSHVLLTNIILPPKNIFRDCELNLYMLKAFGLNVKATDLELYYNSSDFDKAQQLIRGGGER